MALAPCLLTDRSGKQIGYFPSQIQAVRWCQANDVDGLIYSIEVSVSIGPITCQVQHTCSRCGIPFPGPICTACAQVEDRLNALQARREQEQEARRSREAWEDAHMRRQNSPAEYRGHPGPTSPPRVTRPENYDDEASVFGEGL